MRAALALRTAETKLTETRARQGGIARQQVPVVIRCIKVLPVPDAAGPTP